MGPKSRQALEFIYSEEGRAEAYPAGHRALPSDFGWGFVALSLLGTLHKDGYIEKPVRRKPLRLTEKGVAYVESLQQAS